jgi:predicted GNAT family N-acyltransferase
VKQGVTRILQTSWRNGTERESMIAIRRAVFVVEQGVPIDIELDGSDSDCRHLLAFDPVGTAIGTARMSSTGHIGRIAVVARWRTRGVGSQLVEAMIGQAREAGLESVDLDSQVQAIGFYEKLGFEARGDEFMEAGIAHQNMYCPVVVPGRES